MRTVISFLLLSTIVVSTTAIEITNKDGASFRGVLLDILPNAKGGPAAKIKRDGDGRIFSVPLNALSEKTLIELLLEQSRTVKIDNKAKVANIPPPVAQKQPVRPAARRGKKLDGFNIVMSSEKTAEDIKIDFNPQRIERDGERSLKIYGKLTNNYEQTCEFCQVTVELLDRAGKFIIREDTFSEPSTIKPKQVGNVEIWVLSDLLIKNKVDTIVYKVTGEVD